MALIPVKIIYNDKEDTIEFEDSLTFGETESLISGSVDLTDISKPKIDLSKYRMNLLVLTIKKAPFKIGDITTIKMLDSKVVKGMLKEITKIHPLSTYIEDWMETFQTYEDQSSSDTQSTTVVPPNSDGTKKQSTVKK
jgi:hypothetical protein|tara:strand:- start:3427 stop:3840 length:414 start_codon:yes stop_codon:yes gene_type:complete